jgi:hypothetical protein
MPSTATTNCIVEICRNGIVDLRHFLGVAICREKLNQLQCLSTLEHRKGFLKQPTEQPRSFIWGKASDHYHHISVRVLDRKCKQGSAFIVCLMRPIDANNFWKCLKETYAIWQHPATCNKNVLVVPCSDCVPTSLGIFLEIGSLCDLKRYRLLAGALSIVVTMERLVRLTPSSTGLPSVRAALRF